MTVENTEKPAPTDTNQAQSAEGTGTPPPANTAAPAPGTPPAAPATTQQPGQQNSGRYVPDAEFKRIKDEAARKGRAALAKKYGFASVDELDAFLASAKGKNGAPPPSNTTPPAAKGAKPAPQQKAAEGGDAEGAEGEDTATAGDTSTRGADSGNSRQDKSGELAQRVAKAERKAALAIRDLKAERMQHALEKEAWRAGVQDTDYAIHLFKRHLSSLTEEEAVKVDPAGYFTELKTTHPYVFGTATVPATTTSHSNEAPDEGAAPPAAKGKAPNSSAAAPPPPQKKPTPAPQKSVMDMSAEEYAEWKKSRGLDANALSSIPQKRSH